MALDLLLLQAFAAGVIGFFAPCSVAMLPAYVAYFLGLRTLPGAEAPRPLAARWEAIAGLGPLILTAGLLLALWAIADLRATQTGFETLRPVQGIFLALGAVLIFVGLQLATPARGVLAGLNFGLITTAGILLVFVLIGVGLILLIGGLRFAELATTVLVIGALLMLLGLLRFFGVNLSVVVPIKAPRQRTITGFFLFGIAYGLVSLGCNLPIFGVPVFGAFVAAGQAGALLSFLSYGAGVGLLMVIVSMSAAWGRGLTAERLRRMMPVVQRVTSAALVLAGGYIIYYYATVLSA